ncbi:hypothetical protein [Leucobacter triazinivorans]|uniref:Uncharacterized protein n=1 Tax=Leucobacter triazinivorans TaxID=1784719 RepID=A0A4P6KFS6_9MICO|nr:hypothetical protein [Leucobacter triazinivorans]QBE48314.1 hypothetical protein EVS81_05245 [Leucobacter triazinivorans]
MSKDPLEELFGPAPEQPQPVPARERLAQEQAERVRTAQLPMEQQKRDAERPRGASAAKPWIIVGLVAVLAIIVSIVVVNLVRGADAGSGSGEASDQTAEPTTPPPTTPDAPEEGEGEGEDDPEPPEDDVPRVEVGPTMELPIPQWGVNGQLSSKFGSTSYTLENGNTELWLDSALIRQLPCEGNWGATQLAEGQYEVLRPAESCAAAPELYEELWGLTDAFVQSIRPAG